MTVAIDAFIHRFEPAVGPERRVLVLLHGTGGNEDDLLPLGRLILPGAALVSPRGKTLEHGMPRFFRRIAEGLFDLEDLRARTHELADWLEVARAAYALDGRPLIAAGFSNGANIAASLLLLRPEVLAGAVLLRATLPFEPESPPTLAGVPVWIGAGGGDPFVRAADVERLATVLRQGGATVDLEWAESGHSLTPADVTRARAWLQDSGRD